MKVIAFFNNKGGVGKTSLVYHVGSTLADKGKRVLLVDLDPQSNLTAICVDEDRLEQLWVDNDMHRKTMRGVVEPIIEGIGDIQLPHLEPVNARLALISGDIRLSEFEAKLSDAWPRCMDRDPAAFRVVSSFSRAVRDAAEKHDAEFVLIDVGPNLGALNRSALLAADYVVTPLAADLFSLQGLRNLGPTLARWRDEWHERLAKNPSTSLRLPEGRLEPVGYVVMQPNMFGGQVTRAYDRWLRKIPSEYERSVLGGKGDDMLGVESDPHCLAVLRHYRSLMPLAQTARKPIFKLTAGDGAIGSHAQAVREVGQEFRRLVARIESRIAAIDETV